MTLQARGQPLAAKRSQLEVMQKMVVLSSFFFSVVQLLLHTEREHYTSLTDKDRQVEYEVSGFCSGSGGDRLLCDLSLGYTHTHTHGVIYGLDGEQAHTVCSCGRLNQCGHVVVS